MGHHTKPLRFGVLGSHRNRGLMFVYKEEIVLWQRVRDPPTPQSIIVSLISHS